MGLLSCPVLPQQQQMYIMCAGDSRAHTQHVREAVCFCLSHTVRCRKGAPDWGCCCTPVCLLPDPAQRRIHSKRPVRPVGRAAANLPAGPTAVASKNHILPQRQLAAAGFAVLLLLLLQL